MLLVEDLWKFAGKRPLLQNLSFQIAAGEIYGLLGPNGAGKTTTINLICDLLRPDQGRIQIDHQPVSVQTKSLIGVVPQENLLYRNLTCAENLRFFAQLYGVPRKLRSHHIQDCLAAVNLQERANQTVETLSGGMQRRLSLAVALVHHPKLVILDEPTTGLDIEARYEVWELIRSLQRQGITLLLTTHLLEEAERLCDRIGIIRQGQILAEGTLSELQRYVPAKEVVVISTVAEEEAIKQVEPYGFVPRRYGTDLAFWIPEHLELRDILDRFDGIPLDSISRQPVRLEHIYVEIVQQGNTLDPSVTTTETEAPA